MKIVVEIGDVWFYTLTLLVWHRAHCITELKMYRKYRYPYVLIRIAEPEPSFLTGAKVVLTFFRLKIRLLYLKLFLSKQFKNC